MTAPRISAKSSEDMDVITSQALANISGKFPEILNFRKIYNPIRQHCVVDERH